MDVVYDVLTNSNIERLYKDELFDWEGGMVIVFNKDFERGLAILGYTEIGEWAYYLQFGSDVIITSDYPPYVERIEHLKKKHNIQ